MRHRPRFHAFPRALAISALGLTACTFNIASHTHELAETSDAPFSTIHFDGAHDASLTQADVFVVGTTASTATARARLTALRSPGESSVSLAEGWSLLWSPREADALEIQVSAPSHTDVWLDQLDLDVPSATALNLALGSNALDVSALAGRVDAVTTSGAIEVETTGPVNLRSASGSILAHASAGTLEGDSGSIDFVLDGWVRATTTSGSIVGQMGDGGLVESTSGSIDLLLNHALSRDLIVQNHSGSIDLTLPSMPCTLVVTSDHGDVSIHLGALVERARNLRIDIEGGGPLVQVTNVSGSIAITGR